MHTRGIVALSVVLGLIFVTIMVVVARILWVHQRPVKSQKDERSESSIDPVKRRASLLLTGGALKKLFTPVRIRSPFVHSSSSALPSHGGFRTCVLYRIHTQQVAINKHSLTSTRKKNVATSSQPFHPSSKPVTKPSTHQHYSAPYKDTPAPFPSKPSTMPSRMNCGPVLRQNARHTPRQSPSIC